MVEPQNKENDSQENKPKKHEKRKIVNYLIDVRFQVMYAFVSGIITFGLCALLIGIVLWQANASHQTFMKQRKRATELVHQSRTKTTKLIETMRKDTLKELAKVLQTASDMVGIHLKSKDAVVRNAATQAKKLLEQSDKERIKKEEKNAQALVAQRKSSDLKVLAEFRKQDKEWLTSYENQQSVLLTAVLIFGMVVVVLIFLFNIRFTHKAAGPLYKIRKYIASMKDGRLGKVGKLRKGDQLQDFHDEFCELHKSLVEQTEADIEALTAAVALCEEHGISAPALEQLKKRLATKRSSIQSESEFLT